MRYHLMVFDFDGTLMDTQQAIVASLAYALKSGGFPVPPDDLIWGRVGHGLRPVLADLTALPAEGPEVARLAEIYLARFDQESPGRTRPIDGIVGALARLKAAGVKLAIATNRGRASLEDILREHGLLEEFDFLITSSCVAEPKPAPEMLQRALRHFGASPRETLMIGDTIVDVRTGHAAGVDTCAVTYGAQSHEALLRENPTHIVHRAADLPALLPPPPGAARRLIADG